MSDTTLEALATEIRQRFDGIDTEISNRLSDDQLSALVRSNLEQILASDDHDFVRKVRFGAAAPELAGTKYARLGLSVGDVEMLHQILSTAKANGVKGATGPSEELEKTFAAITEGRYVHPALARADDMRRIEEMKTSGVFGRGRQFNPVAYHTAIQAAMDTAETGFGLQLIGAQYVSELWEAARRESRVFNLIESFPMTDPTAYLPVEVDIPELLFVAENTANNSSDYTTVKTGSHRVQVDAKKFVIHQMWSGEMEEDSIIPFLPFLQRQAVLGIAHYSDSLVLNGDTTNAGTGNINLDDADPADTKHYLAFDGIRHAALVDNTANAVDVAGAISLTQLSKLRGLMLDSTRFVDWGHPTSPDDLVYVSDPDTADRVGLLDEIVTVDKYGPQATVLTGETGKILGHPHVASIAVSKTEADGKVSTTANNNTKGQTVCFNRRGFKVGWRRQVMVETERLPGRDQTRLVYSLRMGFGRFSPTGAASGIEAAAVAYNQTL
jgi:HK97 family phage major capsid protein